MITKLPPLPDDWVARANAVPIEDLALRLGAVLKASGVERIGPCPACGGTDRFGINVEKNIFNCRVGGTGGGPIKLLMYVDGISFREAVLELTGERDPADTTTVGGAAQPSDRASAPAVAERQRSGAKQKTTARRDPPKQAANIDDEFRQRSRKQAYALWKAGEKRGTFSHDTLLTGYFALRGITALKDGSTPWLDRLRLHPALPYSHHIDGAWQVIHTGPAMLGAIVGADGRFIGLHRTWLDLDQRDGKATITHPATGEVLASKKVLGSQKGGHIVLADGGEACERVAIGEGTETVASWAVLHDDGVPFTLWAGVSLGNITGRTARTVPHPTKTRTDRRGRVFKQKVPGPDPAEDDTESLTVPDRYSGVVLLGDGDSDPFTTRCAMARAERRHGTLSDGSPRAYVGTDWAPDGKDWNNVLREPGWLTRQASRLEQTT